MRKTSPADSIIPKTRQRILAVFLMNSDKAWYLSDLARHLGYKISTVKSSIIQLTKSGILKSWKDGNRVYYQADEASPVFPELKSFMAKTAGLVDVLREELAPLDKKIKMAFVFGSVAKGQEKAGSDIDMIVVGSVTLEELVPSLDRATHKLMREVNPVVYTVEEFSQKAKNENRFIKSVLEKGILYVIGTEHDLEAITSR